MNLAVALTTFLLVLPVELPDKTLMATLVLSTRYRPLPVLARGVGGVRGAVRDRGDGRAAADPAAGPAGRRRGGVLFAVGAVILLRGERRRGGGRGGRGAGGASAGRLAVAATSFGVLFAAEWGDASQLATAALTARYEDPVSVFVGSFVALVLVATLAVVLGGIITRRVPLRLVQRVAGVLFAVFALVALWEAVHP